MAAVWGNISPIVKEHIPQDAWNSFPVPKNRRSLVETIAANVKALREKAGFSQREVSREASKRSKIDAKSISNMERGEFTPTLETIEAVAAVFGKEAWQLLRPGALDDFDDSDTRRLVSLYASAPPSGRLTILRVAEMAGQYESGDEGIERSTAQKPRG